MRRETKKDYFFQKKVTSFLLFPDPFSWIVTLKRWIASASARNNANIFVLNWNDIV